MKRYNFIAILSLLVLSLLLPSCSAPAALPTSTPGRVAPARTPPTATPTQASTASSTALATGTATRVPPSPTRIAAASPPAENSSALNFYNLGLSYADKVDYDRAIESYTQAIQLRPDYSNAYLQRGLAYCLKHDTEDATADWRKVGELPAPNPSDVKTKRLAADFIIAFANGC